MFPKNANRLRGFDWRGEERPNSVEDLFKDDKPKDPVIIKGLDDYIPPEDFFDENLRKRVEDAKPSLTKSANKAARNIPKKTKTLKKKTKVLDIKKPSGN